MRTLGLLMAGVGVAASLTSLPIGFFSSKCGLVAAKTSMLSSAFVAFAVIAGGFSALACDNCLDPKIHRLCLGATDYPSCMEEMKGDGATAANKEESASLDLE